MRCDASNSGAVLKTTKKKIYKKITDNRKMTLCKERITYSVQQRSYIWTVEVNDRSVPELLSLGTMMGAAVFDLEAETGFET